MNKIRITLAISVLAVAGLAGCSPAKAAPSPSPGVAASAQEIRDNMREWLRDGGSQVSVPLLGDLQSTADGNWATDPFLTKVVADALTKDVVAAKNYQPVPDARASVAWVAYLNDLKVSASLLEGVGGGYQKQGDPLVIQKAATSLAVARQDLALFQARLAQINAARGTH